MKKEKQIGLGLEAYKREKPALEKPETESLHLFDMNPEGLHDMFRDFDEVMEQQEGPHLVRPGKGTA